MQRRFLLCSRLVAAVVVSLCTLPQAQACTCFGTTGIGTALTEAEVVVVGVVEGRREIPPEVDGDAITVSRDVVAVRVLKMLKGSTDVDILISSDIFCYRSFNVEDLKTGETYVFPIERTESSGVHMLPSCSHSALKVMDGRVYTHELTKGFNHELEPYMNLRLLEFLLPTGMLSTRAQIIALGVLALLLSVMFTARYRRRQALRAPFETARGQISALRSLSFRAGLSAFTMLVCAAACIYIARPSMDWIPWALSALFAIAACGIALRWSWSEGLFYGLAIIVLGICSAFLYDYWEWYLLQGSGPDFPFAIVHAIALGIFALMSWCAITVWRRFGPWDGPAPQSGVQ